jgi:conjugative transfer region protein TrbK
MRPFGVKAIARALGLIAIGLAIAATEVHSRRGNVSTVGRPEAGASGDTLARELLRCRAIGMAAKDDAACETAWAENRRRFFAPLSGAPSLAPNPDAGPPR